MTGYDDVALGPDTKAIHYFIINFIHHFNQISTENVPV